MRSVPWKTLTLVVVLCSVWFGNLACGRAATYYVDSSSGNDGNDGLSVELPWKSVARVNAATFQPGDAVLFKRGGMWREQLIPPSAGIANYPITFGAYGSGPRPVLSGANLVNGLPYMVNDSFTGNALRGWVKGRGTVVAANDRLEAVLDDIDNTAGDYLTKDVPETKEAWLMYRFNLPRGYSWSKDQAIIGSGIIDGAFVGLVNSAGSAAWRIRVERDGGFDYYVPAIPALSDGLWYDVKLHVRCASAAGANDGMVQVWINGVLALNLSGVDNDTKKLKKISMGNTYYAPAGVNMRVYLDDVRYSSREIDGTESVAWVATGASGSDGGAIYRGYSFYDSSTLFENYNPLRKVVWNTDLATTAPAMQKGTWTLDSKNWILYVIPSAGGLPDAGLYEATARNNSIAVTARNYTRYQGLELKNSDRESLLFMNLSGIELDDILAHHNGCQGTNLSAVQGQSASDVYIHNSEFRDSSWNGVSIDCYYGPSSNIRIENNIVFNNIHNGIDFKASGNYSYSNITVSGNKSYNNGTHGLYMQNYPGGAASNATIARNAFYRNSGAGVYVHKNFAGQDHSGIRIHGNTFAYNGAVGGFGPGVFLDAIGSDIRNNSFYTDSVTATGNSEYRMNGSDNTANFNNSFDRTRVVNLYSNGAAYTFTAFQALGFEANGSSVNPRFTGEFVNDYTLKWDSPSIDAGTPLTGVTTDILGNPIYGAPDLGAFEYQPPYSMGIDKPDLTGNVRIYADGKYRNTATPTGVLADLTVAPEGGFYSGSYAEWMNLAVNAWEKTGIYEKSWLETAASLGSLATVHTVGDLQPSTYYAVAVDTVVGAGIQGAACSAGICLSDPQGRVVFTYTGGYSSGSHSFSVRESGAIPTCVALTSGACYSSISLAYQALSGSGTILVRNMNLTENLLFDRPINVSILGGFNAGFTTKSGTTTVHGTLDVTAGTVSLGTVSVR